MRGYVETLDIQMVCVFVLEKHLRRMLRFVGEKSCIELNILVRKETIRGDVKRENQISCG